MERKTPQFEKERWNAVWSRANQETGLLPALVKLSDNSYYYQNIRSFDIWGALTKLYGVAPDALKTPDAFWHPKLVSALESLTDRAYTAKIRSIIEMRMGGQFSTSPRRRSYRSEDFSYYATSVVPMLGQLIRLYYYKETVQEMLFCNMDYIFGYEYLLALELQKGNQEIISFVKEAIYDENTQILISRDMIEAIIISGHEALVDDLLKLLLAARRQEGLRQQILESADKGSIQTLTRILKLCIDQDLFRYSSTIRAFDTWTGLGYGDAKPANIKQYAILAYTCLTDENKRQTYLQSGNNVEAYFSLWAQGCYEMTTLEKRARELLDDSRHYRQVLGWLFISRSDSVQYQRQMAHQYLHLRDEELLAWVVKNLCQPILSLKRRWVKGQFPKRSNVPQPTLPQSKEERYGLFTQLKDLAVFIGNQKRTFTGNPFDFVSVTLENEPVLNYMMHLAAYDMNDALIAQLLEMTALMNAEQRQGLVVNFLLPEINETHREFLYKMLEDRSVSVKEQAVARLSECTLKSEDLKRLAQGLRSKSSDLRKQILSVLCMQPQKLLEPAIGQMLQAEEEYQVQAAIELLMRLKEAQPALLDSNQDALQQLPARKLTTQTEILLDQLITTEQKEDIFTPENGFGLYDPKKVDTFTEDLARSNAPAEKKGLLSRLFGSAGNEDLFTEKQMKTLFPTWGTFDNLLGRLDQVFVRHADYEIEKIDYDGSHRKVLFGDMTYGIPLPASTGCRSLDDENATFEMLPFHEEFEEALGDYTRDVYQMLGLYHITADYSGHDTSHYTMCKLWFAPIAAKNLAGRFEKHPGFQYPRYDAMLDIFQNLPRLFDAHEVFIASLKLYKSMIAIIGEQNLGKEYLQIKEDANLRIYGTPRMPIAMNHRMLGTWRTAIRQLTLNDADFADWFSYEYRLEALAGDGVEAGLTVEDYFRAVDLNVAPREVLLHFLLNSQNAMPGKIRVLTNPIRWAQGRRIFEHYPWAKELVDTVIHRIITVEAKRGELPTPVTQHALAIERFEGAAHFCNLLAALGKENFFRGYEFCYDTGKKAVLSSLLKRCYPTKEDTPQTLAALLKKTDIKENRLAEAVMYAPQWAGFAEKILDWPGLKCGVWFFHAHINETFTAEKETETAIYSPITPLQFNDGAFDKNWFFQAYQQLGEKRFQVLHKSAKYITAGSNQHRRSQLYSDAARGKLDIKTLEAEITEKRNQEKLRCYPLIPLPEGDTREALRRYEFIQKFLKEGKQFGAQRRESEKKACGTAMENLAITTGLMDVNRLMWQMESAKFDEIRPLLSPVELDGVSLRLHIDDNGDSGVLIEKSGKVIKTVPKAFSKHEIYLGLKETVKELKEQKRRSKESLERAMMETTEFTVEELCSILQNPVLAPMLQKLVWISSECKAIGFPVLTDGALHLTGADSSTFAIASDGTPGLPAGKLRLAHPHDLKEANVWADFMHLLYERKLVQPFKQVFREYYPITEDERQERTISRRYAGHQVQPKRTVALLKGRGWTVDYEQGLQKVFYKENLIVRMFALADWFSPADIEAPTLETVEFFDRNTEENVPLEQVPPILFSETMRDLDLVVSVAHVGGVDPEASHSTVEMRTAIAAELLQLLKVSNVSWIGAHAKIVGQLANYSVHMGSGVVHAEGKGMIALLPVHSQARGRIFLPFADEDPKTAEILSKIILLAEDQKIKDPGILGQIC